MKPRAESREPRAESREPRAGESASRECAVRASNRSLAWLLVLAFSGLCVVAATSASGQVLPPEDAYEWAPPDFNPWDWDAAPPDATDAANWHSPDGSAALPTEGAHLLFGNRPAVSDYYVFGSYYDATLTGFGSAPLPSRFASLWFGFGELDDVLNYELTGSEITVGYGMTEDDRLIVANGKGAVILDLDILIHDVPGLDFRIVNHKALEWEELKFAGSLTSHGTLIVDGYGRTAINALHGTGELIKEGSGTLDLDAANYTGELTIRDGALVGTISDDSALTLAGGVYGFNADTGSDFERGLGEGAGNVRWLAGAAGGFSAHDGAAGNLTLDGGRTLTWGEEHFVSLGSELLFGSEWAEGQIHWHNALDLGDPLDSSVRTIRVEGATDYYSDSNLFSLTLSEELIAAAGQKLRFIGNGTVVISADNANFHGDLEIAGVTLSLDDGGRFGEVGHFTVREGGTLAVTIGWGEASPLAHEADITLHSATLRWEDYSWLALERKLGDITLASGANRIERTSAVTPLRAKSLTRIDPRSTLLVWLMDTNGGDGSLMAFDDTAAHESAAIEGILPWLVVTVGSNWAARSDWGIFEDGFLKPYLNYYEGSESTWDAGHNVNVTSDNTPYLSDDRTINSLRLDGILRPEGHTLTIGSGGLLVGANAFGSIYDEGNGSGYGAITTAAGRPLYVHTHGELYIYTKLTGGMDLVKTGASQLVLPTVNYETGHTNDLGSLIIHEGTLAVQAGVRIATTGKITVGDGGHEATLILDNWRSDPEPFLLGKPDLRLRGGHGTGPDTAATLRLIGSHDLKLNHLEISGNSVLEFQLSMNRGGTSKIYSEVFTIDPAGRLLVRGWIQMKGGSGGLGGDFDLSSADQFTHILVRKTSPGLDEHLRRVWFEEYGPAKKINWAEDDRYWEIVPGGWVDKAPEPSTYGAILAALGTGLVVWRKRRKQAAEAKALVGDECAAQILAPAHQNGSGH